MHSRVFNNFLAEARRGTSAAAALICGKAPPFPGVSTFRSGREISVDDSPRTLAGEGDRKAVGEGFSDGARRKQPLTPGFAVPSPLRPLRRGLGNVDILFGINIYSTSDAPLPVLDPGVPPNDPFC